VRAPFAALCAAVVLLAAGTAHATAQTPATPARISATTRCAECHLAMDDETLSPPARAFAHDVHARAGFTCASCHGGDPNEQDQELAHWATRVSPVNSFCACLLVLYSESWSTRRDGLKCFISAASPWQPPHSEGISRGANFP